MRAFVFGGNGSSDGASCQPSPFAIATSRHSVLSPISVCMAQKPKPNDAICYTGGQALSLGEIADIVRIIFPDADIRFQNEACGDPLSIAYRFENTRLRQEFGIKMPSYERCIARMRPPRVSYGHAGHVGALAALKARTFGYPKRFAVGFVPDIDTVWIARA